MAYNIVLDTNVLISAMRSRGGASFRLVSLLGDQRFNVAVSVPLMLEYESVASRPEAGVPLTSDAIAAILDRICLVGRNTAIFFRWRPHLRDPGDELVLELAVAARCRYIVTYNAKDFQGCEQFGISVISPAAFLRLIGETHEHDQPAPS
jgi:putative PIN family toxin of toxin-antitoxin system